MPQNNNVLKIQFLTATIFVYQYTKCNAWKQSTKIAEINKKNARWLQVFSYENNENKYT